MAHIPSGYLEKKGGQWRQISLVDVVALLYSIHRAEGHPEIGFEDAGRTLEQLSRILSKKLFLDPSILESALWSANLLNEKEMFWHPRGKTFEEMVKDVVGKDKYNTTYNLIEKKDD